MTAVAFSHIAIRASNLDAALALYRDRLGFRPLSQLVVTDTPSFREAGLDDAEMVAWFGHRDGTVIELQVVTSRSGAPIPPQLNALGYRHLALRVADVAATGRALESAGGRIDWSTHTRTSDADVDGEAVFGSDPDGQRLELLELSGGAHQPVGAPIGDSPPAVAVSDVVRFDHVALGVSDVARALEFYTCDAFGGVVEHRDADQARVRVRVFDTTIVLEQVPAVAPQLGIRRLVFVGAQPLQLRDPDGAELVVALDPAAPTRP